MICCYQEGQHLYLKPWEFNCVRVFNRIAEIVKERGGKVADQKYFFAHNRLRDEVIRDCEEKIARYSELNKVEFSQLRADAIREYQEKLTRALSVSKEPIRATFGLGIRFILDGFFYSYGVDENPLFPYRWCKTPIRGNQYSYDACHGEAPHDWCYDQMWKIDCADEVIEICAKQILDFLLNSKTSTIIRDRERKRIDNIYDGDYHYEWVPKPERMKSIENFV